MSAFRAMILLAVGLLISSVALGKNRPNIVWIMTEDNSKHYLSPV